MTTSTRRDRKRGADALGRLHLRQSGRFELPEGGGCDLEPKDALLLAYLALEGSAARGRLAKLLWPDVEEERAGGNLRQRLLRLKRATGIALVTGGAQAQLAAGLTHDLDGAHELLQALAPEQAGGLSEWLEQQRERRRRGRAEALAAQAAQAEARGDLATALEHAHAAVDLEPLSEEAHLRAMRLHYLAGDAAAALAAYDRCVIALRAELGVAPGAAMKQLRSRIEQAVPPAPTAFPMRGIPVTVLRPPRLIGRDAEWTALQAAWSAGSPAFVLGEAGLGKSRLVTDFARAHGGALNVSARPGDERAVYAVAARLLRQVPRERFAAFDASVRRELARLLPELGEADPIRSEAERSRFYNAVGAVLHAAGSGIAGAIVDDLHFADDASIELIHYLTGDQRMPWVFAGRPAELGVAARRLLEALRVAVPATVLELAPLTLPQLEELVASLGIEGLDPADRAALLLRQTGGNPLFALEVVKGWLSHDGSTGTHLPAGPTVGALVTRRIGQLSAEAVRLARCAAIAGQDFSAELATHVLGVRPLDLADAWVELEAAQVFKDGAFAHDLIYEAAVACVPAPVARELHRQVAQFMEAKGLSPGREAEHWLAAGAPVDALPSLARAAEEAKRALRLQEAYRYVLRAAEIAEAAGSHGAAYALARDLVTLLLTVDRAALDEGHLDRVDRNARTAVERVEAVALRAHVRLHQGRFQESADLSIRGAEEARATQQEAMAANLLANAAGAFAQMGDPVRAVRVLHPVVPWALERADDASKIFVVGQMAACLDLADRQSEAQDLLRHVIEIGRRSARFHEAIVAYGNLAISQGVSGFVEAALATVYEARKLQDAYDVAAGSAIGLGPTECGLLRDLRRYGEALAVGNRALDAMSIPYWQNAIRVNLACALIHLGQFTRAEQHLMPVLADRELPPWLQARAAQMQGRSRWSQALGADAATMWRGAADAKFASGRTLMASMIGLDEALCLPAEAARRRVDEIVALADRIEHRGTALAGRIRAADLALRHDDAERACAIVEEALAIDRRVEPNDLYRGELWLVAVQARLALGKRAAAIDLLRSSVDEIRRIASEYVPPEFRQSFLTRNPANRELLALEFRVA